MNFGYDNGIKRQLFHEDCPIALNCQRQNSKNNRKIRNITYNQCDIFDHSPPQSCTKGPGDHCGGKDNLYGTCGEGLMCSNCNRCIGCSRKTFECFDDRLCITGFK